MNPKFSWNRFCKVVAKDGRSLWNSYGLTMLIISLIPLVIWLLKFVLTRDMAVTEPSSRIVFFYALPFLVAIMAPSRMYRTCNLPKEGIYFAMLPASKLEKYLSMILYCVIICPLLCLVAVVAIDTILSLLPFGPYLQGWWVDDDIVALPDNTPGYVLFGVFVFLVLHYFNQVMLFMFTSTIFKRHKVSKTFLCLIGASIVLTMIFVPISMTIASNHSDAIRDFFGNYRVDEELLAGYIVWILVAVRLAIAVLLVWWTGHRLKKMRY